MCFKGSKVTTLITVGAEKSGFGMVKKRLGCKWFGLQMESEIWKPNHLKSGQIPPFWPSVQMVGTIAVAIPKARPFENPMF